MKTSYDEIAIYPVENGFIAQVGCMQFIFAEDNKAEMVRALADYLDNPKKAEEKWEKLYE